ncbi:hypothetical protein [Pallidibacillus thermolactis]|jgi:hypothetical protein|uniref:hypothetical protein n=1 Tax=Pallidibacillus thermolactis TaxID=251051 RepID=UPI0021D8BDCE|nr:hypothetical protein [Pallidibacillus thermolactis]MCU9602274.1 hypothetical protein [Pallidibacillus thermolactis subsp. kokeshiiformis]MED1673476.1 hypothetical protein [Pallidibacillus thermolactis subsp. kokeshiiformis]
MKKKKRIFLLAFLLVIIIITILINNFYSANSFVGYVQFVDKEQISDNYSITVESPDYGEFTLDFKHPYTFNYHDNNGNSSKKSIDEVWEMIEPKSYYVHIRINKFPYNLLNKYTLLDIYFD